MNSAGADSALPFKKGNIGNHIDYFTVYYNYDNHQNYCYIYNSDGTPVSLLNIQPGHNGNNYFYDDTGNLIFRLEVSAASNYTNVYLYKLSGNFSKYQITNILGTTNCSVSVGSFTVGEQSLNGADQMMIHLGIGGGTFKFN